MKALRLALTAARLAAPVLPRDETSAPRRDGSTFDYPSDSSLQQAAHGLLAHGLLLEFGGWTLGESTITCAWTLTHIESDEAQTHVLEWPLFTDMPQRAHATAAAISHAWRHLVMQLLGLRVEPRRVQLPATVDDLASWGGGKGVPTPARPTVVDDPVKADGGKGPPPARPTPYEVETYEVRVELLAVLVEQWNRVEAEHDSALGHPARTYTMADVFARCRGLSEPRMPKTAAEFAELAKWLREQMR